MSKRASEHHKKASEHLTHAGAPTCELRSEHLDHADVYEDSFR